MKITIALKQVLGQFLAEMNCSGRHRELSVRQIDPLLRRGVRVDLVCCWFDLEPRGIERRKEQQHQHRADRRAADQRIGH